MFKKIIRIVLWAIVGLLMLFLSFVFGSAAMMTSIENSCMTLNAFQLEDKIFECRHRGTVPKNNWKDL